MVACEYNGSVEYEVGLPVVPGSRGEPAHEERDQNIGQSCSYQACQTKQLPVKCWRDVPAPNKSQVKLI
jgi:hypothetical protein